MVLPALLLAAACAHAAPILPRAYSHNDYKQPRPLFDALDNGFMGVEADVHLRGRELLVGHTGGDVKPGVTLQSLYLEPLKARVKANGGRVHPGGPKGFLLMVEFKSDGDESYLALREILRGYQEMLTSYDTGKPRERAVTLVITGHRPDKLLRTETLRWAAIDGDLSDAGSAETTLYSTISADWASNFDWRGGRLDGQEQRRLAKYVSQAHARGRHLRFWAIPDREEAWALMYDAGVDRINTNKPKELAAFLRRQTIESSMLRRLRRYFRPNTPVAGFDGARAWR